MRQKISSYTGIIIAVNVGFFLLALILGFNFSPICDGLSCDYNNVVKSIALQPKAFLSGTAIWTVLTSMFMHGGVGHLFVNMFSLMFLGSFVEQLIGKKRFLWFYLGSGIFAGLFFVLVASITGSGYNDFAVGASGALFALGGLLMILTPKLPVLVFFILPLPMWAAMIFLLLALWGLSASLGLPIGNVAHLGGIIVGLGYGYYLRLRYPHKTKMIRKYFSR